MRGRRADITKRAAGGGAMLEAIARNRHAWPVTSRHRPPMGTRIRRRQARGPRVRCRGRDGTAASLPTDCGTGWRRASCVRSRAHRQRSGTVREPSGHTGSAPGRTRLPRRGSRAAACGQIRTTVSADGLLLPTDRLHELLGVTADATVTRDSREQSLVP